MISFLNTYLILELSSVNCYYLLLLQPFLWHDHFTHISILSFWNSWTWFESVNLFSHLLCLIWTKVLMFGFVDVLFFFKYQLNFRSCCSEFSFDESVEKWWSPRRAWSSRHGRGVFWVEKGMNLWLLDKTALLAWSGPIQLLRRCSSIKHGAARRRCAGRAHRMNNSPHEPWLSALGLIFSKTCACKKNPPPITAVLSETV